MSLFLAHIDVSTGALPLQVVATFVKSAKSMSHTRYVGKLLSIMEKTFSHCRQYRFSPQGAVNLDGFVAASPVVGNTS